MGRDASKGSTGAGLTAERVVSLTAREQTEILFLDLSGMFPGPPKNGGAP